MIQEQPPINNIEQKEKIIVDSTSSFMSAIEMAKADPEKAASLLCAAEKWLESIKKDPKQYPNYSPEKDKGRWIDHQERALFKAYRDQKDWDGANRIIESMQSTPHARENNSRQGRIEVLSKEIEAERDL